MVKKSIFLPAICWVCVSCASLTKTQINSIAQFAEISKDFSTYPQKIVTELASIKMESRTFDANAQLDRTEHVNRLERIYADVLQDKILSKKMDLTLAVIDSYAQSLLLLSEKNADTMERQTKNVGMEVDSLIAKYNAQEGVKKAPTGIGASVSQFITFEGRRYLQAKQANEIKKVVPKGNLVLENMTANLIDFLEKKIYVPSIDDSVGLKDLIINQQQSLKDDYGSYLASVFARNQLPPLESDKKYLELKDRLNNVEKLRKHTISATRKLKAAHEKLTKEIETKKTLKEKVQELQALYEEINALKQTLSTL